LVSDQMSHVRLQLFGDTAFIASEVRFVRKAAFRCALHKGLLCGTKREYAALA
jgi:hypothetical protein